MDAGIADTINRQTAKLIASYLDAIDKTYSFSPWHLAPIADTFMGDNDSTDTDRAWLVGTIATQASRKNLAETETIRWDSYPADGDWDNLFANLRAEVRARRDPKTPSVPAPGAVRDGVGSE